MVEVEKRKRIRFEEEEEDEEDEVERVEEEEEDDDEEAVHMRSMAVRREDNYERKEALFAGLPSSNLYEMRLKTGVPEKNRRDASVADILEVTDTIASTEHAVVEPALPTPRHVVMEAERETGARRLVAAKLVKIQPMHRFFQDNVGALLAAKRKQTEEAGAEPSPPPKTLSIGKRSSTLGDNGAPKKKPITPPALPPLLPDDPASNTLARIDLQSALLLPWLDEVVQYVLFPFHLFHTSNFSCLDTTTSRTNSSRKRAPHFLIRTRISLFTVGII
jgi:hypothetical protein